MTINPVDSPPPYDPPPYFLYPTKVHIEFNNNEYVVLSEDKQTVLFRITVSKTLEMYSTEHLLSIKKHFNSHTLIDHRNQAVRKCKYEFSDRYVMGNWCWKGSYRYSRTKILQVNDKVLASYKRDKGVCLELNGASSELYLVVGSFIAAMEWEGVDPSVYTPWGFL
ncbi:hypothetical protein HDV04_001710 [Boothiomyces sp. JEL0838]|nr:hypothetical protein HDV04_001710 [Boothiomyces sp. JEL0838]